MDLKEKHAKLWDLYWTKFVNIVKGCIDMKVNTN